MLDCARSTSPGSDSSDGVTHKKPITDGEWSREAIHKKLDDISSQLASIQVMLEQGRQGGLEKIAGSESKNNLEKIAGSESKNNLEALDKRKCPESAGCRWRSVSTVDNERNRGNDAATRAAFFKDLKLARRDLRNVISFHKSLGLG
jgi:hypothetical protein